jgi:hypothetical protein
LRAAVSNALAEFGEGGDWAWLQEELGPFEDHAAHYWGNAFTAYALASAPCGIDAFGDVDRAKIAALKGYLTRRFADADLHGRMMAVRAARKLEGLLRADQVAAVAREVLDAKLADGSWSIAALGRWTTKTGGANEARARGGDGYATGLAILCLIDAGVAIDSAAIVGARRWLLSHQDSNGAWPTKSLNKPDKEFNNTILSDAATAYAIQGISATLAPVGRAPHWTEGIY